ncbi:hypothetical protein JZU71_02945, partial [bacterium]|nr:hypothetical protein [bacterium]
SESIKQKSESISELDAKSFNASLLQTTNCPTSGNLTIISGDTCSLAAGDYTFDSIEVNGTLILLGNPTSGLGVTI